MSYRNNSVLYPPPANDKGQLGRRNNQCILVDMRVLLYVLLELRLFATVLLAILQTIRTIRTVITILH